MFVQVRSVKRDLYVMADGHWWLQQVDDKVIYRFTDLIQASSQSFSVYWCTIDIDDINDYVCIHGKMSDLPSVPPFTNRL